MEDKRYSFSNVTVRIYDEEFLKDLSESFKKMEIQFANSKSAFIVYYFKKGFEGNYSDPAAGTDKLLTSEIRRLSRLIDGLAQCFQEEKKSENHNLMKFLELQAAMADVILSISEKLGIEDEVSELKKFRA